MVWCVISPKNIPKHARVKNICIASVYISPKSRFKRQTIAHIVESIQVIRSYYANEIYFWISGDFNKFPYDDILDCLGSLQSIQKEPTRKGEVLDLIITDLHTQYLPCLTLPPLDVDENKKGVASDHRILIFPPASNKQSVIKREKKTLKIRPISHQNIIAAGRFIGSHSWRDLYDSKMADEKVNIFHDFLKTLLDRYFPLKEVKRSPFDKKWFTPSLKSVHHKKQGIFLKIEEVKNSECCGEKLII